MVRPASSPIRATGDHAGFRLLAAQSAGRALRRGPVQAGRGELRVAWHAHRAGGQDRAFVHAGDRRLADDGDQPADAGSARAGPRHFADDDFCMVTVTHAAMGEAVFGIAPGQAEVWATLRTRRDERMEELAPRRKPGRPDRGRNMASPARDYHEIFVASVNAPEAVEHLRAALDEEGVGHRRSETCRCAPRKISACSATAQVGDVLPRCRRAAPDPAQSGL